VLRETALQSGFLLNKAISPNVLRHTSAIRLLHAGETTVIALWLGHETTRTTDI
jgi:site-specific recombinase XerD